MARVRLPHPTFWTALIAALLLFVTSGLPVFAAEIFGDNDVPCATDCERSPNQKHCPPNCHSGACAKIVHAIAPAIAMLAQAPLRCEFHIFVATSAVLAHEYVIEVFHPPRI